VDPAEADERRGGLAQVREALSKPAQHLDGQRRAWAMTFMAAT
jgi:hypothetical protein